MKYILAINKYFYTLIFVLIYSFCLAQDLPKKPNPPRLVNDYSNLLTESEKGMLERKLVSFNDSTSNQVVVVIVPSTNGYAISDYAFKLGTSWGIGEKDKNNGVLLLISTSDRKMFIAVGYGLEAVIPDAYAKRIVSSIIRPYFKQGNFYEGIDEGTTAIMKLAAKEYNDPISKDKSEGFPLLLLVVIAIVVVLALLNPSFFFGYLLGNILGSLLGNQRGWNDFTNGGGDFGGFGGGDFGGGGAGGDW